MKILPLLLFTETLAYRRPGQIQQPVYRPPSMDFNRRPDYDLSDLRKPSINLSKPSDDNNSDSGKNLAKFETDKNFKTQTRKTTPLNQVLLRTLRKLSKKWSKTKSKSR